MNPIAHGLLVLAVTAGTLLVPAAPGHALTTAKTAIQYVLSPHPDDVFEAWSLVQDSSANYPVFITLTAGESTGNCGQGKGSRTIPYWDSFDLTTVTGCKGARMASLDNWFDDQSDADPYLDDYLRGGKPDQGDNMVSHIVVDAPAAGIDHSGAPTAAGMVNCKPIWGSGTCAGANPNVGTPIPDNLNAGVDGPTVARRVVWSVGPTSARVAFDLGDGNLTDAEVVWAMGYVRANRALYLPLTTEYGVIAAGYANLGHEYTACYEYSHHDHRAVQEAVYGTDLIPTSGYHPQWGATCGSQTTSTGIDPEGLAVNGGRANMISNTHYAENMSGPTGYFQVCFGWLNSGSWPSGPDPVAPVLFSQWNYFWRHFT